MFSIWLKLACYGALVFLLFYSVNCFANQTSCGDNINISFPFGLKSDSDSCSDQIFTLLCEENRTVVNLFNGKYAVLAIDYINYSIRLADVAILSNQICSSFPVHPLTRVNFTVGSDFPLIPGAVSLLVFLTCENPVKSSRYVNRTAYCNNGVYSYLLVGDDRVRVWDLADLCRVETMAISSSPLLHRSGTFFSFLEVHEKLTYGFEVSWELRSCKECRRRAYCLGEILNFAACSSVCSFYTPSFLTNLWRSIKHSNYLHFIIIGAILVARFLFAPCAFGFIIYTYSRRHFSMFDSIEDFLRSQNNLMPIRYSYSDIKKMTGAYRDKLGEGGYGSVYKGKLRSGHFVAVKLLSKPKANGQEFINEVATIGRIHHVNVVQLIGFCAERFKRALVYDFMPNGSLEKYIFSQDKDYSLSCTQMYEISLGVARGIEYLHQGCDMQILHFDIKPHNILLDENFTPKVSDFGLAKLYPTDDSIVPLTAARGTMGYMAPELFYKNIGGVSYKADVYSFGMLLMDMAGRRRNWKPSANSSQIFFPSWVYDQFMEGKHIEMGETTEQERVMVKKMMIVGLWCIQMKPTDRPSMNEVVEMLEGDIGSLHMPPKPFLCLRGMDPILSGACADAITLDISPR